MKRDRWKSRKNQKRARGRCAYIKSEAQGSMTKAPKFELSAVGKAIQKIARRGDRGT